MERQRLTLEIIHVLHRKLVETSERDPKSDCIIFSGSTQNGYGMIRKSIDNERFRLYAHQVALLHNTNMTAIPDGLQCSHLCHIKLCVNVAHLSLESQSVNNNRNMCRNERKCSRDHANSDGSSLPDCIFD